MIPQVAASLSRVVSRPLSGEERPPLQRGPVIIHWLRDLIPRDCEHSIPSPAALGSSLAASHSPPIKTPENQVFDYLALRRSSSSHDKNSLWNVVHIADENRGRLRNDKRAKGAIINLLLATTKSEDEKVKEEPEEATNGAAGNELASTNSDLQEVQSLLLLRGDHEAAGQGGHCQFAPGHHRI